MFTGMIKNDQNTSRYKSTRLFNLFSAMSKKAP